MAVQQLTITAEQDVIQRAEMVAAARQTTISEMVREFLESVGRHQLFDESKLPPLTRAALGMAKGVSVSNRHYKEILAEEMSEKYEGLK